MTKAGNKVIWERKSKEVVTNDRLIEGLCLKNLSPLFAPGKGDRIEVSLCQLVPIRIYCQNRPHTV